MSDERPPSTQEEARAWMIAQVQRDLAEYQALDEQRAELDPRDGGRRRAAGSSAVFSVRLDPQELAALERRAAYLGIRPSVLARNYIRLGLANRESADLRPVVDRLAEAIAELQAMAP